jgi:hypothetical protein
MKVKVFFLKPKLDAAGKIIYSEYVNGVASPIYTRTDTGEEVVGSWHPGAIYDARETAADGDKNLYPAGPDGRCLCCTLPTLEQWYIDNIAANGPGWQRTGRPEDGTLNVNPSVVTKNYHGFLLNGELVPC